MSTSECTDEEAVRLRRAMRDLVALSTLPAIWIADDPERIARSLADALVPMLDLDLAYIRLRGAGADCITEVVRGRKGPSEGRDGSAREIGQALAPLLEGRDHERVTIRDPFGDATLRTAVTRFGHSGDFGALVAASSRPDFPTEIERLLLGVGANQTALILRRSAAERVVHEERERLRVTLASIGDAVITTDTAGRITSMNAVAQELTGWAHEEAAGRPLGDVFRIVSELTLQPAECPAERALREGRVVGLANHTMLIAKDGGERPIDDSAAPIRDAQGGVAGVVLVFRDASERRRSEEVLRERMRLVELRAETSAALASREASSVVLQQCAAALVHHLGLAFARIWTLREDEQVLLLRASAGMYTHLDGPHSRVEVGRFKIGRIAQTGRPHLTNTVATDPNISDPAWAEREGLVAFAGYPLAIEGRVVGVLGMFSAAPLSEAVLDDLVPLSDAIAQFIERRRAEAERSERDAALRRSQAQLQAALAASETGTFRFDPATRTFLEFDENLKRIFGFGPGEPVNHADDFLARVHPDDLPLVAPAVERTCRDGDDFELEYRVLLPGGGVRWLFDRAKMERDTDGKPTYLVGACTDVTRRRELEEEARAAGERFRSLADSMSQKIFTATPAGDVDYFNPVWSDFTGLSFEQIRHWGWTQFIHPDDVDENVRVWRRSIETGVPFDFEHRFRRADGQYRWHVSRATAQRDPQGRIVLWMGSNTDIHDVKQAEEALRASEEYFRDLAQNMPLIVWTSRPDGSVDYVNRRWLDMTGQTLEYVRSNPEAWMSALHPDDRQQAGQICLDGVRSGAGFVMEARFLQAAEGGYRWHLNRCVPLRDVAGNIQQFLGTCTDIEDQKRLETSLREADRRKDEFLATLAHELRNPLARIRTGLELMRVAPDDRALIEQVRGSMESQTRQLVRLIDDLLDISRITSGKVTLRLERVELASVVRDAIDATHQLVEALGHELTVALPSEPILLDADSTRMAQIFSNLLTNAARYTKGRGRIHFAAERHANDVVVTVTDTGIGIPEEMLDRIFEMFAQVDRSLERSQGGLGIGLSLVKRLVELHGGSVEARSAGSGKGSEFTVRLPAIAVGPPSESPATNGEAVAASGKLRILVVDDNQDAATVLAILLKTMGNETRIAHDGLEAIEMAAEFRPKILLMDIGMPRLNGYEAARRIRAEPWGKSMLLVALTGWGQDDDRRRTEEAGFDRHLVKPVDPAALREVLAELQPSPDAT